jgi:hypothetical protein
VTGSRTIEVVAGSIRDEAGRVLLVRKRGTAAFMQGRRTCPAVGSDRAGKPSCLAAMTSIAGSSGTETGIK